MEVMLIGIPFLIYIYLRIRLGNDISDQERDEALFVDGIELLNQEDYVKAFRYFDNAIKEHPKSATAYFYRAKCHYYFENWEAALNDFEKTLRIDNSIAEAYLNKANCFYMLEDYETALFELKRASRMFLGKNADVIRFIGELEFRGGDFESAEKNLKIASSLGDRQSYILLQTLFIGNIRIISKYGND
jgi:tetratricopeptide (TPR) repeat protein